MGHLVTRIAELHVLILPANGDEHMMNYYTDKKNHSACSHHTCWSVEAMSNEKLLNVKFVWNRIFQDISCGIEMVHLDWVDEECIYVLKWCPGVGATNAILG